MAQEKDPHLMRIFFVSWGIGFLLSALFLAMLIWFNLMNVGHLILHTEGGYIMALVFWVFTATLFGGVQFSLVIMGYAED
ncbi:hypothetical protein SAMN04488515_0536 [Cognatiyoonia koreensis]|uniref:Uncharacterized protein n=1 Tax=Cognatiyoonia koreensis TaxID=364200 RepID=A0A1I0NDU9_9RHOB|nr:hypothetical protein [Cognatiyoonia koreensis]SEV98876.1 hypothetical protein SAMN04488515_0536 [Cognatiyoonia koreensis]